MGDSVITRTSVPTAPYSSRPPSPPAIAVPSPGLSVGSWQSTTIFPTYDNVDPSCLSRDEYSIITQNCKPQVFQDVAARWKYADRRTAQEIVSHIYLGPYVIARNKDWLQRHGITMLLAARDARMAQARVMGVSRVAEELGINTEFIDVSGDQELIRAFPDAVRRINNHMLAVHHEQAASGTPFRTGKVLVFCETGNDRSAAVVAAYLMSIYGMEMVKAVQLINWCRFCTSLDDNMKHLLKTFSGLLVARKSVHQLQGSVASAEKESLPRQPKRTVDATKDVDDSAATGPGYDSLDSERFANRQAFQPFVDSNCDSHDDITMGGF